MEVDRVEVRLLFFAKARELMECEEMLVCLPKSTTYKALKRSIFYEMCTELASIEYACALAVDLKYVHDGDEIYLLQSSQIAVIPPLCAG
ncbi:unnamed protein product [Angiostrongylus costaricensis]|uniref:Molybdopterin synthase sulfur carrier subunit n=1 Tax=Angiostrongylus costaricensis TaxID=334426 RepID=A0A0R3PPH3_ANGCS|nr:unnamed protein product [Angiostrongylus costaricensis]